MLHNLCKVIKGRIWSLSKLVNLNVKIKPLMSTLQKPYFRGHLRSLKVKNLRKVKEDQIWSEKDFNLENEDKLNRVWNNYKNVEQVCVGLSYRAFEG